MEKAGKTFTLAVTVCLICMPAIATVSLSPMPSHHPSPVMELVNQEFVVAGGIYDGLTKAYADSTVYAADNGNYIYAYQLHTVTVKFAWFAVLLDSVTINAWGMVESSGILPIEWCPVEDSLNQLHMEAFFTKDLTSGDSALLWFTSTDAPGVKRSALAKMSFTGVYAEGNVLGPVPEPATMLLLGLGGLMLRRKK